MSAMTSALIVTLVGALVSTASLVGPPSLPPESAPPRAQEPPAPAPDPGQTGEGQPEDPDAAPPPRSTLPPGLQPVPFPLENQRPVTPPTSEGSGVAPSRERRSIVDLRDPFNRPPPRLRGEGHRDLGGRLLMPDLKDPFAPGVRRVRSKTLDQRVPNDIRDPFRSPPPSERPVCTKTTADGTVVQAPGKKNVLDEECQPSALDLRDPFDRASAGE